MGRRSSELQFQCTSNLVFLMASSLYLVLSVYDFQWEITIQDIPEDEFEGDAVWARYGIEDDYVFETPQSNVMVSKYMMIYFCASLCFVSLGVLEWIHTNMHMFGIFFVLAGCFGVLSAIFVEKDEDLSNDFNIVSCCLFYLEGLQLFLQPPHHSYQTWMRFADSCFFVGAVLDVITSIVAKFSSFSLPLASVEIFSSCLWLICPVIYSVVMICRMNDGEFRTESNVNHAEWKRDSSIEMEYESPPSTNGSQQEKATSSSSGMLPASERASWG